MLAQGRTSGLRNLSRPRAMLDAMPKTRTSFKPGHRPAKPFPKGTSGNPGGVPVTVKHIRELALSHAPAALKKLVNLVDSDDERIAVHAAEAVLDRAGLRPFSLEPEKVEVTGDGIGAFERLSALLARRLDASGAADAPRELEPPRTA